MPPLVVGADSEVTVRIEGAETGSSSAMGARDSESIRRHW